MTVAKTLTFGASGYYLHPLWRRTTILSEYIIVHTYPNPNATTTVQQQHHYIISNLISVAECEGLLILVVAECEVPIWCWCWCRVSTARSYKII